MAETPIEISYLPSQLRQLFTGKLAETSSNNSDEQNEANFLSRALAAYSIHKLSGCTLEEAADSVVDGGGDGGIDAIYYSSATSILWVVQSKFMSNGRGEPKLEDVNTFKCGLENLLQGKFQVFNQNQGWRNLIPQLEGIFKKLSQVRPVLTYSGINIISEDRRFIFEDLKHRFNSDDDYLDFQICNLTTIHDWLIGQDIGLGIDEVEMKLLNPSWVRQPYETVLGLISLKEIASLYTQHGKQLIAANIRAYKGKTSVNDQIVKTVREEPENFFYLNNGLTAYCERLEVHNLDRANTASKRIVAFGFSIINGAQTLGSVAESLNSTPATMPAGNVFIKIISLQKCIDERTFAERITRSTNFQNQIGLRDFVAQDDQQQRIASQLKLANISYHFKDGAEAHAADEANFSLQEATTALACLAKQSDCDDFCARILANRKSLWSMEVSYPNSELLKSRYSRIFRADYYARTVWRAVQIQRILIQVMQNSGRTESGVRKAFFENSRWLLLIVIYIRFRLFQGNDLTLTEEEIRVISQHTIDFAERLWNICVAKGYVSRTSNLGGVIQYETSRHFRSVFCNPSDCQILRHALLTDLADSG